MTFSKTLKTRISLRRDTQNNWKKIENDFIPLKGEMCFIDFGSNVIRSKVGDGNTTFKNLPFLDVSLIEKGYHNNENGYFYKEQTYTNPLIMDSRKIYIDIPTSELYECDGELYNKLIGIASADKPGLVKLYNNYGQNIDGTMTQKSITEGIDEIEFAVSETDSECLTLTKPW